MARDFGDVFVSGTRSCELPGEARNPCVSVLDDTRACNGLGELLLKVYPFVILGCAWSSSTLGIETPCAASRYGPLELRFPHARF